MAEEQAWESGARSGREPGTRKRILSEALRLFASKGYHGTSIADIEAAAGLSPGAGSLYWHFQTKQDLLAETVADAIASADALRPLFDALPLGNVRAELTLIARVTFWNIERWKDLYLVMLKHGDEFPELFSEFHRARADGHVWFADWLRSKIKSGELIDHDAEAATAIYMHAIVAYWLVGLYAEHTVDRERFIETWVDLVLRALATS